MKLPLFIENIIRKFEKKQGGKPMTAKEKWMLFLLSGLLLAVIVFPSENKETNLMQNVQEDTEKDSVFSNMANNGSEAMSLNQYEIYLSEQLEDILSQIDGVGDVQAWVTIASSSEKIFFQENDSETKNLQEADSVGGTRIEESSSLDKTVVTDSGGNPYIVKTLQPEIEGVLVVAEGAGNSTIKKNISDAAQVLFGIDAHRIKVAKKKVEE